jgi:NADH:ubiquinone oxidoreductase subunit H
VLGTLSLGGTLVCLAVLAGAESGGLPEWAPPVVAALAQFSAFMAKVLFFAFGFIWIRWTLPRFRYDQLMRLGWKNLMPLALVNVAVTGIVLLFAGPGGR